MEFQIKKGVKTFKTDVSLEVLYDGRRIQFDVKPKIIDGSVLVPIRFVAEKMGGKLEVKLKDITITKNDKVIKLTMESKNASFNGKSVTLHSQLLLIEDVHWFLCEQLVRG